MASATKSYTGVVKVDSLWRSADGTVIRIVGEFDGHRGGWAYEVEPGGERRRITDCRLREAYLPVESGATA